MTRRALDECPGCHRRNVSHHARGLCGRCYNRNLHHHTHTQYPGLPPLPRHRKPPPPARCTIRGGRGEPPDPLDVKLCLAGEVSARTLSTASRVEVVRVLAGRGLTDAEIERRTWWFKEGGRDGGAVCKFRARRRIPPGRPRPGWRYP